MPDAKQRSLALDLLDFDGAYEITYQDVEGSRTPPHQAFVCVRQGKMIGLDSLGCTWSGTLRRVTAEEIEADILFDPTSAPAIFVPSRDGSARHTPQRHGVRLKELRTDRTLVFTGDLMAGGVQASATMKRIGAFNDAGY